MNTKTMDGGNNDGSGGTNNEEDAYVDSFFLPGGILDPTSYEEELNQQSRVPLFGPSPAVQNAAAPSAPAVVPENPWAATATTTASASISATPSAAVVRPPPGFETVQQQQQSSELNFGADEDDLEIDDDEEDSNGSIPRELMQDKSSDGGSSTSSLSNSTCQEEDEDEEDDEEQEEVLDLLIEQLTQSPPVEQSSSTQPQLQPQPQTVGRMAELKPSIETKKIPKPKAKQAVQFAQETTTRIYSQKLPAAKISLDEEVKPQALSLPVIRDADNQPDVESGTVDKTQAETEVILTKGGAGEELCSNQGAMVSARSKRRRSHRHKSKNQKKAIEARNEEAEPAEHEQEQHETSRSDIQRNQDITAAEGSAKTGKTMTAKKQNQASPKTQSPQTNALANYQKQISFIRHNGRKAVHSILRTAAVLVSFGLLVYHAAFDEITESNQALLIHLFWYLGPNILLTLVSALSLPHWTSHCLTCGGLIGICLTPTPEAQKETGLILWVLRAAAFVNLLVDGFVLELPNLMMWGVCYRVLMAFVVQVVRYGYWTSPFIWWSLSFQLVVAYYLNIDQVVLLAGLASIHYKRQMAKNANK